MLSALIVFGLASCRKDNSMGFTPGAGAPTITSVHTLSKSDTSKTPRYTTSIDTSGNITNKDSVYVINPAAFDSVTTSGQKQNYYVIYGTNLGTTTSITFNGVIAYFNRSLITDKSLVVSIPTTVPTVGNGATNKIVVTTEKDAMRLRGTDLDDITNSIPLYVLPIEVDFKDKAQEFNDIILNYVRTNKFYHKKYS